MIDVEGMRGEETGKKIEELKNEIAGKKGNEQCCYQLLDLKIPYDVTLSNVEDVIGPPLFPFHQRVYPG